MGRMALEFISFMIDLEAVDRNKSDSSDSCRMVSISYGVMFFGSLVFVHDVWAIGV